MRTESNDDGEGEDDKPPLRREGQADCTDGSGRDAEDEAAHGEEEAEGLLTVARDRLIFGAVAVGYALYSVWLLLEHLR